MWGGGGERVNAGLQGQPTEWESVFWANLAVCLGATSEPKSPLP